MLSIELISLPIHFTFLYQIWQKYTVWTTEIYHLYCTYCMCHDDYVFVCFDLIWSDLHIKQTNDNSINAMRHTQQQQKNEQMRYWAGICWSLLTKIPEVDFCKLKLATIAFYFYDIATKSVWIAFGLLLTAFKLESKMKNNTHNYLHDQFFDDYSRANIRFTIKKAKFTHVHSPVRKFPGYYWIRMVLAMIFFKMTNHWFRLPIVDGTLWKWCFFYNGSLKATCIIFRNLCS